ncbi:MAG: isochorismate synthase [Synechococcales bacterium]|nr:isochorismate synthase [Synechococcales bacterium]
MTIAPLRPFSSTIPDNLREFVAVVRQAIAPSVSAEAQPPSARPLAVVDNAPQLVSIALPLPGIDPLRALAQVDWQHQPHFFWEQGQSGESLVAIGQVLAVPLTGGDRFQQAQGVVEQWLQSAVVVGATERPFAGPHCICRFTFFDQTLHSGPFPSASLFIPRWQVAQRYDQGVFVMNLPRSQFAQVEDRCAEAWQIYQSLRRLDTTLGDRPSSAVKPFPLLWQREMAGLSPAIALPAAVRQQFMRSVAAVLRDIDAGLLHKAVLANVLDLSLTAPCRLVSTLQRLRQLHPDCHLFSTGNGNGQIFLGASPERLLSIRNRDLQTEAIAGSAPRGCTPLEDARHAQSLLHSPKELLEHRLVVDYITQQLENLGLSPQRSPLPGLRQLANIQHLQTPICAHLPQKVHPLEVVAALHPTPAVAGVPQPAACRLIQQYEPFERSLYAAPLGWIDPQHNSEFIVGIRSALVSDRQVRLYAGAGIVKGSNPQRELSEIELKLQALRSMLL